MSSSSRNGRVVNSVMGIGSAGNPIPGTIGRAPVRTEHALPQQPPVAATGAGTIVPQTHTSIHDPVDWVEYLRGFVVIKDEVDKLIAENKFKEYHRDFLEKTGREFIEKCKLEGRLCTKEDIIRFINSIRPLGAWVPAGTNKETMLNAAIDTLFERDIDRKLYERTSMEKTGREFLEKCEREGKQCTIDEVMKDIAEDLTHGLMGGRRRSKRKTKSKRNSKNKKIPKRNSKSKKQLKKKSKGKKPTLKRKPGKKN